MLVEPAIQPLEVGRPALSVTDRVELELEAGHAQPPEQVGVQRDQLGVDRRIVGADCLHRELPVLAEAAALRRRVTPHWPHRVELQGLRLAVHPVLHVRTNDRRRGLRPQRQRAAAAVLERVHLLLDDFGAGARRAGEDLGVLERGRIDPPVAVQPADVLRRSDGPPPRGLLGRNDVVGAARRLKHCCAAPRGTGSVRARRPASSAGRGRSRRRSRAGSGR